MLIYNTIFMYMFIFEGPMAYLLSKVKLVQIFKVLIIVNPSKEQTWFSPPFQPPNLCNLKLNVLP